MSVQPTCTVRRHPDVAPRGFSITELLVVIGIIVLLIGILLPALGRVREKARVTETTSVMEEFAKACDAFNQQFGFYPGIVPEEYLANDPKITPMENAVLHLQAAGAAGRTSRLHRRRPVQRSREHPVRTGELRLTGQIISFAGPSDVFRIAVYAPAVGDGPFIQGKRYAPFFSPKGEQFRPPSTTSARKDPRGDRVHPDRDRRLGAAGDVRPSPTVDRAAGRREHPEFPVLLRRPGPGPGRRVPRGLLPEPASVQHPEPRDGNQRSQARHLRPGPPDARHRIRDAAPVGCSPRRVHPDLARPRRRLLQHRGRPRLTGQQVLDIISGNNDYGTPTVVDEYDDIIVAGGG